MSRTRDTGPDGSGPVPVESRGDGTENRTRPRRPSYFAKVPEDIMACPDVGASAFRLWCWLDLKAGTSTLAKASYPEMAEAMPFSERSVERHIKELLNTGWLRLDRPGKGHGKAWYRVRNPARSADSGDDPKRADRDDAGDDPGTTAMTLDDPVEPSAVSPLLESLRDLEGGSARVHTRERDDDPAKRPACSMWDCDQLANGERDDDGQPYCVGCEPF